MAPGLDVSAPAIHNQKVVENGRLKSDCKEGPFGSASPQGQRLLHLPLSAGRPVPWISLPAASVRRDALGGEQQGSIRLSCDPQERRF